MAFDVGRTRPEYGAEHPPPHARCARGRRVCSKIDQGGGAAARGPPTWCSGNGTASIQRKNTVSIPDTPSRHGPQASGSAQLAGDAGRPCVLGGPSRPPPITHRSIRYTNPDAQPADVLPCPARLPLCSNRLTVNCGLGDSSTTALQIRSFLYCCRIFSSLQPSSRLPRRIPSLRASFPRSGDRCFHSPFRRCP